MITAKEIGKKFTVEREKQGLTLAEAARKSGIHQKILKDIENGIFDRIGELYIKSFIKKYSFFLEMNISEIMDQYKEVSLDIPNKKFNVDTRYKENNSEEFLETNPRKIQFILVGVLLVILLGLILVFVSMVSLKIRTRSNEKDKVPPVKQSQQKDELQTLKKPGFFTDKKTKDKYSLTVKAIGDVWVQIKKNDENVYVGVLKKGETRKWDLTAPVNVWTGKAENLEYTIDGQNLGTVSTGVVKNIILSGQGLKIDGTWAARTDQ